MLVVIRTFEWDFSGVMEIVREFWKSEENLGKFCVNLF